MRQCALLVPQSHQGETEMRKQARHEISCTRIDGLAKDFSIPLLLITLSSPFSLPFLMFHSHILSYFIYLENGKLHTLSCSSNCCSGLHRDIMRRRLKKDKRQKKRGNTQHHPRRIFSSSIATVMSVLPVMYMQPFPPFRFRILRSFSWIEIMLNFSLDLLKAHL